MIILYSICSIIPARIAVPVPFLHSIPFLLCIHRCIQLYSPGDATVQFWCPDGISRVHTLTQGDRAGETPPFGAGSSREQVGDLMILALPLSYSCTLLFISSSPVLSCPSILTSCLDAPFYCPRHFLRPVADTRPPKLILAPIRSSGCACELSARHLEPQTRSRVSKTGKKSLGQSTR